MKKDTTLQINSMDSYELYKNDKCVMDHLSGSQIIALATLL